jgi:diguanylate cyclase (GGDEF)-like protein
MTKTNEEKPFLENDQLLTRLEHCTDLPSPPGVAVRIIELGKDPNAGMSKVAAAVSVDPALAANILRIANSAFYTRQRKTENLRQALTVLGLNATLTLALSFSLVRTLSTQRGNGMDHMLFWRRSIATATACRVLCRRLRLGPGEQFFLAGLLQDIGMLALDKAVPELYREIGEQQRDHDHVQALERQSLGADHATVGAWLLESWKLPDPLLHAVAGSHDPSSTDVPATSAQLVRCTALSGAIADIWSSEDRNQATQKAAKLADTLLGMDRATLSSVLDSVGVEMQATGRLFDVDVGDAVLSESLLHEAKEILTLRSLQSMQFADELQTTAKHLESRTRELEEAGRRDGLTGLYNRAYLDKVLAEEFAQAKSRDWPISIAFADLDHFKTVNDNHGHLAGDEILQGAARLLIANTRDSDIVARYGGEEFVVILPGTGAEGTRATAERIVEAFRTTQHQVGSGKKSVVTISIGITTHGENVHFEQVDDFLRAADQGVYAAKREGRNRFIIHAPVCEENPVV